MREVSGKVELNWTVVLPEDHQYNKKDEGLCEDPVIEAVLKIVPQMARVLLREDSLDPVSVYTELHEEDFWIEEDSRDRSTKNEG